MRIFNFINKYKSKYKIIEKICTNINEDNISAYSAQCSYYTILSFIPFIILLITSIQYTNIEQETLFNVISRVIPASMNDFVLGIVREVYSKSVGTISISIIFTIWSAGRGLFALNKGLNSVYDIDDKKSNSLVYIKLKSIIQTILFIILIIAGIVLLVFGSSLLSIIQKYFVELGNFKYVYEMLAKISFIFLTFIIFLFLYKFMPKHKVSFKSQMIGAVFGAVSLNVISFVFSIYLDVFRGFSITYGSLTTLMLIMMWTYACFYIILLGAEFNKIVGFNRKV